MTKIILFIIARNSFKKILDIGQLYIQSCIVVDDKIDNLNVCVCVSQNGWKPSCKLGQGIDDKHWRFGVPNLRRWTELARNSWDIGSVLQHSQPQKDRKVNVNYFSRGFTCLPFWG